MEVAMRKKIRRIITILGTTAMIFTVFVIIVFHHVIRYRIDKSPVTRFLRYLKTKDLI